MRLKHQRVTARMANRAKNTITHDTTHHRRELFQRVTAIKVMSSKARLPLRRMKSPTWSQNGRRSL